MAGAECARGARGANATRSGDLRRLRDDADDGSGEACNARAQPVDSDIGGSCSATLGEPLPRRPCHGADATAGEPAPSEPTPPATRAALLEQLRLARPVYSAAAARRKAVSDAPLAAATADARRGDSRHASRLIHQRRWGCDADLMQGDHQRARDSRGAAGSSDVAISRVGDAPVANDRATPGAAPTSQHPVPPPAPAGVDALRTVVTAVSPASGHARRRLRGKQSAQTARQPLGVQGALRPAPAAD